MEQPINFTLSVLQALVCDSGVPRKVLPLYESRGGGASFWHRVQAETSCGPRDQNPCSTGAASFETFLLEDINVSELRGLNLVRATVRKLDVDGVFSVSHERICWLNLCLLCLID